MTAPPSISVVILSWNRREEIETALDRLRRVFDEEVVVVDQGSTDGSAEYLAGRNDIHLVTLSENVGVAAGRNIGNERATGDIVVSLDSDAGFAPSFDFEALGARFSASPDLAAVAFRIFDVSDAQEEWPHPISQGEAAHPFPSTRFHGAGHALRRSAFLEVGMYDPALFFYWEEMDLSAKLIAAGHDVWYLPEFVVEHERATRGHMDWETDRYFYRIRNRLYLVRKFFRGWAKVRELTFITTAYAVLGVRERLIGPAVKGIVAGFRMPIPEDAPAFDSERFYGVWDRLERSNRPGPTEWLNRTSRLIRGGG